MYDETPSVLDAASAYIRRGWWPIPIPPRTKRPILDGWPQLRIAKEDVHKHFQPNGNIGLILGEASGWLVDVDLDCVEAIELADQYLPPTSAITGRPHAPGSHRWYIAEDAKTAKHTDPQTRAMIVELRSTGLQTVVGPSIHPDDGDRYDVLSGEPTRVSALMLSACVAALAEAVVQLRYGEVSRPLVGQGDVEFRAIAYLDALPPAISGQGGHNAAYGAATALVHGFGIDPNRALSILLEYYNPRCDPPWSEKELEHKVRDAANKPHDRPFGWLRDAEPTQPNISSLLPLACKPLPIEPIADADADAPEDPGPLPQELLRVPGFVSEVMDYCLETAPYPNPVMAFCGALALQAFLACRKVRDPGDNRTNLYLLGLAHSAAGKDWPRKVNTKILHQVGLADGLGERFASGEGIQDALFISPSMLFQTDEIDGLLQSINKARDARHENVMSTLLTLYSSANSVFPMRRKAGRESPGAIDQPSLVIFGTAIPNHYYEALSERMLTNGFFARMIILECGRRGAGQEPQIREIPTRVLDVARWWSEFRPGTGNLTGWHPVPVVVPQSSEAQQILTAARIESETEYEQAEAASDAVATTVWGRLSEQSRKLALLYAISENAVAPEIGRDAAAWAVQFAMHQTRRMLYMAAMHASDTDFEQRCNRVLAYMKERDQNSNGEWIPYRDIIRRFRWSRHEHEEVRNALIDREHIEVSVATTAGRSRLVYRLRGDS